MQFRDEVGTVYTPVPRWIQALGRTPDHCFGNNQADTAGSTLVHEDCFFVPIRVRKADGTHESQPIISTISPPFVPELELKDIVMCYLQPTTTDRDHTRASRWTLLSMWEDTYRDYVIHASTGNGTWTKVKAFAGILDLSAEYGSYNWSNGVIGSAGIQVYRLDQLIVDDEGHEFYHPLTEDPRLTPDELPMEYRGRLALPQ
jgi:hypothetical protein